ncbi:MAG: hypothetical protein ABSE22_17065 [Xanthobacteraceae bacterium]|jgi:hypothetical protein
MNMNKTPFTPVAAGVEYELLTAEDGVTLVLHFKTEHLAAHLEGDDAIRFRADYEAIRLQFPSWPPDQTLAQLWDQGGYSWLAAKDEYYAWAWLHW